jgi:hypothetical protein
VSGTGDVAGTRVDVPTHLQVVRCEEAREGDTAIAALAAERLAEHF